MNFIYIHVCVYLHKYPLKKIKTIFYLLEGQEQDRQGIPSAPMQSQSNLGNSTNGNRVLPTRSELWLLTKRINKGLYF